MKILFCGASLLLLVAPVGLPSQALSSSEFADIVQTRRMLADSMRGPQSPLNMVLLQKLQPGRTAIGSASGNTVRLPHVASLLMQLHLSNDQLSVLQPAGGFPPGLTVGGKPAAPGPVSFDADGTSPTVQQGPVSFVLRQKFGYFIVGRDLLAPNFVAFHGLRWYAPNGRYRVLARWKPWQHTHVLPVANVLGQVNRETSYGVAEFTLNGRTFQLEPSVLPGRQKPLFFVFRDSTSRTTTYGSGRFLDASMPSNGLMKAGTVVLDFNVARNPWCAFSVHTSCPLPPVQNRLRLAVPAGEMRYGTLLAQ